MLEVLKVRADCNQASSVEFAASRRLLLDINRISEELDIIHDILNQQKDFFKVYKALLDPDEFERSSVRRVTRFQHEKKSIQRNIKAMEERIRDCQDLMKRTQTLAAQNLQLVETYQDDKNKVLMIFTFVTIVFLPLSFVTGFFGMNVVGVGGTTYTVRHFWVIAIPVTVGVGILCFIMMYWAKIARLWKRHSQKLRKKVHKKTR
jgi:Mg2+ and Co2+ transporter CorA